MSYKISFFTCTPSYHPSPTFHHRSFFRYVRTCSRPIKSLKVPFWRRNQSPVWSTSECVHHNTLLGSSGFLWSYYTFPTVDGRTLHQLIGSIKFIPLLTRSYTSRVAQDCFHQQYDSSLSTSVCTKAFSMVFRQLKQDLRVQQSLRGNQLRPWDL